MLGSLSTDVELAGEMQLDLQSPGGGIDGYREVPPGEEQYQQSSTKFVSKIVAIILSFSQVAD